MVQTRKITTSWGPGERENEAERDRESVCAYAFERLLEDLLLPVLINWNNAANENALHPGLCHSPSRGWSSARKQTCYSRGFPLKPTELEKFKSHVVSYHDLCNDAFVWVTYLSHMHDRLPPCLLCCTETSSLSSWGRARLPPLLWCVDTHTHIFTHSERTIHICATHIHAHLCCMSVYGGTWVVTLAPTCAF